RSFPINVRVPQAMVKLHTASRNPYHQYLQIDRGAPGFSPIKERAYLVFVLFFKERVNHLPLTWKYSTPRAKIQEKWAFALHFRFSREVIACSGNIEDTA
ncbi:MAG TPA: hypothetical protein VJ761_00165, partial [Ktedonobacteraceae bacterium]|nr:hypothetical protein [Ktedonobacteraceae bacterium]